MVNWVGANYFWRYPNIAECRGAPPLWRVGFKVSQRLALSDDGFVKEHLIDELLHKKMALCLQLLWENLKLLEPGLLYNWDYQASENICAEIWAMPN